MEAVRDLRSYTRIVGVCASLATFIYIAYLMGSDQVVRSAWSVLWGFAGDHRGAFICLVLMLGIVVFAGE